MLFEDKTDRCLVGGEGGGSGGFPKNHGTYQKKTVSKLPDIVDFETPFDPGYIDTTYGGEGSYAGNQAEAKGSEESEVASLKHGCGNASAFNDGTADSGYTSVYDKDLPKDNNASEKQEQNEDKDDQTSAHRGADNRASENATSQTSQNQLFNTELF